MKEYVLGFLFTPTKKHVALILKVKPEFQKGRLNGIGGSIEPGETPDAAMRREFLEEAGVDVINWDFFLTLEGPEWRVFCARSFDDAAYSVKTMTEEDVALYRPSELSQLKTMANLSWMVPLALDLNICDAHVYE